MRFLVTLLVLCLSSPVFGAPCTEHNYNDPKREPDWSCQGPGEAALVPDTNARPSVGVVRGSKVISPDKKTVDVVADSILMDKDRVITLGMRVKALRRLRWLDLHKGKDLLEIEKKHATDVIQAKLELEQSRANEFKKQRDDARKQRDSSQKWYRSWTFGLIVGVVTTTAATIAVAYAVK